jgi:signal transduction histidine kinase
MFLSTGFQKLNRKISTKGQQQAATAYLGQLALSDIALADLMTQAATLMAQVLSVEYSLIWKLEADKIHLSQKACSGWKEGSTDNSQMPVEPNSLENFTLKSQNAIIIEDFKEETRFKPSGLLLAHGVASGISVVIGTVENPYGILQVFSQRVQTFSHNDVYFLQSIANIMGSVIHLKRRETNLLKLNEDLDRQLVKAQSMTHTGRGELDLYEIKNRLIESTERERLRLAQELHDTPIQDLYGLIYQLEDLKDVLKDTESEKMLNEYDNTLRRIVNSLRTICGELRPPSLSPFGLEVAIRDHVEKLRDQNPDMKVHLELMRDQQILSDSLRLCLFRIYQQAIHNVTRHAEATEVHIRFRWDADTIILEIEDNGKGFEVPQHWVELVRQEHFGLVGLAERMESIRGKLEVVSALGNGTLVRAIVPRH